MIRNWCTPGGLARAVAQVANTTTAYISVNYTLEAAAVSCVIRLIRFKRRIPVCTIPLDETERDCLSRRSRCLDSSHFAKFVYVRGIHI